MDNREVIVDFVHALLNGDKKAAKKHLAKFVHRASTDLLKESDDGLSGYIAYYNREKYEIHAKSLYDAKLKAIEHFKVPKSKRGLLSVELAEHPDGSQVTSISEASIFTHSDSFPWQSFREWRNDLLKMFNDPIVNRDNERKSYDQRMTPAEYLRNQYFKSPKLSWGVYDTEKDVMDVAFVTKQYANKVRKDDNNIERGNRFIAMRLDSVPQSVLPFEIVPIRRSYTESIMNDEEFKNQFDNYDLSEWPAWWRTVEHLLQKEGKLGNQRFENSPYHDGAHKAFNNGLTPQEFIVSKSK